MIVCFHCDRRTKKLLDSLIADGQYKDYAEVIAVAVANLSVLETEIREKGAFVVEGNEAATYSVLAPKDEGMRSNATRDVQNGEDESKRDHEGVHMNVEVSIPKVFYLEDGAKDPPFRLAKLPSDVWLPGQDVPLDRWVFGQYNRLLPAKASCRALANLLHQKPKGIALEETSTRIAEAATLLGDLLSHHDKKHDIGRDDLLSTAFPGSGKNSEKSQLRYANQFVGSMNSEGQISGLLVALKLINRVGRADSAVSLTRKGWEFAIRPNPVLDGLQSNPTEKFTDQEVEVLLGHIRANVPAEDYAYRAILAAIAEGANTPDSIDDMLQRRVPVSDGRQLSSSYLSSQRSGAISRMTDLGLVERVREGVRVHYAATEKGREFAN